VRSVRAPIAWTHRLEILMYSTESDVPMVDHDSASAPSVPEPQVSDYSSESRKEAEMLHYPCMKITL
jgi:hypothetical protein